MSATAEEGTEPFVSRDKARAHWSEEKRKAWNEYQKKLYQARPDDWQARRYVKIRRKRSGETPQEREARLALNRKHQAVQRATRKADLKRRMAHRAKQKAWEVANKERRAELRKQWFAQNPGLIAFYNAKRRALKLAATINLEGIKAFILAIKANPFARCYYCGKRTRTKDIHFDHIIPLAKGGLHSAENLCVACQPCNNAKKDKGPTEWAQTKIGQQLLNL